MPDIKFDNGSPVFKDLLYKIFTIIIFLPDF